LPPAGRGTTSGRPYAKGTERGGYGEKKVVPVTGV